MKKRIQAFVVCIMLLTAAMPSYGVEDTEVMSFTLEQAVEYALANNPQIAISETGLEKAKVQVKEAEAAVREVRKAQRNVNKASGGTVPKIPSTSMASAVFNFNNLLIEDGLYKRTAEMGLLLAEKRKIQVEETLKFMVENSYFNLLNAQNKLNIQNSILDLAKKNVEITNQKYSQGLVSEMDVISSNIALAQAETEKKAAERDLQYAQMNFNRTVGLPLTATVQLIDQLKANPPVEVDIEQKIKEALENRMEVIQASEQYEVDKLNFEITGKWYTPNTYKYQEAKYTMDSSAYALEKTKQTIELSVHKAYMDMLNAYGSLTVLEQSVDQVRKVYEISEIKYKAGMATNTETLDSLNKLKEIELQREQVLLAYNLAQKQFEISCGVGLASDMLAGM